MLNVFIKIILTFITFLQFIFGTIAAILIAELFGVSLEGDDVRGPFAFVILFSWFVLWKTYKKISRLILLKIVGFFSKNSEQNIMMDFLEYEKGDLPYQKEKKKRHRVKKIQTQIKDLKSHISSNYITNEARLRMAKEITELENELQSIELLQKEELKK